MLYLLSFPNRFNRLLQDDFSILSLGARSKEWGRIPPCWRGVRFVRRGAMGYLGAGVGRFILRHRYNVKPGQPTFLLLLAHILGRTGGGGEVVPLGVSGAWAAGGYSTLRREFLDFSRLRLRILHYMFINNIPINFIFF